MLLGPGAMVDPVKSYPHLAESLLCQIMWVDIMGPKNE